MGRGYELRVCNSWTNIGARGEGNFYFTIHLKVQMTKYEVSKGVFLPVNGPGASQTNSHTRLEFDWSENVCRHKWIVCQQILVACHQIIGLSSINQVEQKIVLGVTTDEVG